MSFYHEPRKEHFRKRRKKEEHLQIKQKNKFQQSLPCVSPIPEANPRER